MYFKELSQADSSQQKLPKEKTLLKLHTLRDSLDISCTGDYSAAQKKSLLLFSDDFFLF